MTEQDDDDAPKAPSIFSKGASFFVRNPVISGFLFGLAAFAYLALTITAQTPAAVKDAAPVAATTSQEQPHENAAVTTPAENTTVPSATAETKKAEGADTAAATKPVTPPTPAAVPAVPVVADVALVITDVGLSRRVGEAIAKTLPASASIAISSYATDPVGAATAFKQPGRDVWLGIAVQSKSPGIDPGPLALSAGMSADENADLLKRQVSVLGRNVIGIYIPNDADIVAKSDMWKGIATDVIASGLMILDATKDKVATSVYVQSSDSRISAYLKGDVIIDGATSADALQKALDEAIPVILNQRQAIVVVINPTVLSITKIGTWVDSLAAKGIRLVPASRFTGLKP